MTWWQKFKDFWITDSTKPVEENPDDYETVRARNKKGRYVADDPDTPENEAFINTWHQFTGDEKRVTNDPMEAHYIGFNMWVKAVEKAGTTDTDKVIDAMVGVEVPNLTGGTSTMLPNHHITKPVLIGEIQDDGQFLTVSSTDELVPGDAWSDYLEGSKDLISDWTAPISCGNYNTKTKTCVGAQAEE